MTIAIESAVAGSSIVLLIPVSQVAASITYKVDDARVNRTPVLKGCG